MGRDFLIRDYQAIYQTAYDSETCHAMKDKGFQIDNGTMGKLYLHS